jgi:hypothetical protein
VIAMTRFATMRALFEEYPNLADAVGVAPTDEPPTTFVRKIAATGALREAVAICAYLLRRRDAVAWTCRCLRSKPELAPPEDQAILAAEAWLRRPDEEACDVAFRWGQASDQSAPTTWAAYAAGFASGYILVEGDKVARTPSYLTWESARVAMALVETRLAPEQARAFLSLSLSQALERLETQERDAGV